MSPSGSILLLTFILQRDLFTHRKKRKIPFKKNPKDKKTKTAATLKTCIVGHFIQIPSFGACVSLASGQDLEVWNCPEWLVGGAGDQDYLAVFIHLEVHCFRSGFFIVSETQVRIPWEPTVLGLERQVTGPAPFMCLCSTALCWVKRRKHSEKDFRLQHLFHLGNFRWLKPTSQKQEGSSRLTNDCFGVSKHPPP